MRSPIRSSSRWSLGAVAASAVLIFGCATSVPFEGLKWVKTGGAPDVALVVVSAGDEQVFPDHLIVRKGVHAIVWVSDGELTEITFPSGVLTPVCSGPTGLKGICWAAVVTANPAPQPYKYTIKLKAKGREKVIDPRMEVVL